MTVVSSGACDTNASSSTNTTGKEALQAACAVVREASCRVRSNADKIASNLRYFLQVGHLSKPGENPPSTVEGVFPCIPSQRYLLETYNWSRGWQTKDKADNERDAFCTLWRHCHPGSKPLQLTKADVEASAILDACTRNRYSNKKHHSPHSETLVCDDAPLLSLGQLVTGQGNNEHRVGLDALTFGPEDAPTLHPAMTLELEARISSASNCILERIEELDLPEPEATLLERYLPLASKHKQGFTVAFTSANSIPYEARRLRTPLPSTFASIANRFSSLSTGTRDVKLTESAAILFEHLSGKPLSG